MKIYVLRFPNNIILENKAYKRREQAEEIKKQYSEARKRSWFSNFAWIVGLQSVEIKELELMES
jgi:hypothetical protein